MSEPQKDSPAAKAGIQSGDVITSVNDVPVHDPRELARKIGTMAPGTSVAPRTVARVVAGMNTARARELRQGRELRRLFELSDLLVEDKPLDVLLSVIVTALADVFGARQVALFLPVDGRLDLVSSAGEPLTADQLREVLPAPGTPTAHTLERSGLLVLALTVFLRLAGHSGHDR